MFAAAVQPICTRYSTITIQNNLQTSNINKMNFRVKKPVLKDITVVFTTKTGETRIVLTQAATDSDSIREAVKSASCGTAIAYRVEFITISKNELKVA